MVEHWLPKPGVAGSTPVVRSKHDEGPPKRPLATQRARCLAGAGRFSRANHERDTADRVRAARGQAEQARHARTAARRTRPAGRAIARGLTRLEACAERAPRGRSTGLRPARSRCRARAGGTYRTSSPGSRRCTAAGRPHGFGPHLVRTVRPAGRVTAGLAVVGARQRGRRHERRRIDDTASYGYARQQPAARDSMLRAFG